ncbi:protein BatD [Paraneptunicella aestuarii]|uniref:BatD family protein n=1 Tax=Paraneptunicella aestuarii TaxID=2831148 RepID=UPI001E2F8BBC|nr:BatD family protein [Paraneptunicella aestuarii]UAA40103.1 protein BatD [Paraneptunicella aestuarii]
MNKQIGKTAMQCMLWLAVLFTAPLYVYADVTQVTATVDRNPVMVDESFVLEIIANDSVDADALDTSPLLKDFVVGRTSTSHQTQIINFDTSRTTRWSTVLIPRQPGIYTIPSFTIEGQSSQPVRLEVLPVSQSKAAQGQDVYLTTEVDLEEVYLQQQVRYTVKLHIAMDLQRGSLSAPSMQDGEIEQVGEDKEYSEIINGRRYRIIERTFSIIPQKSGEFTIQAPYFEGEVLDNSRRSFGFFNRTRTINKVGKNIFLKVRPIPTDFKHHWLPSEHVEIHDEWQGLQGELTVGEPVTRTITLTALGVVEAQLPEIGGDYPEQVKTYPDQAETTTVQRNGTFVAQRNESTAIIPNEAGVLIIPAVSVPWFNVVTGKTEFATLPEKRLTVKAAQTTTTPAPIQAPDPATVAQQQAPQLPLAQAPLTSAPIAPQWWSISSWILLVLWLATLMFWWLSSRKKQALVTTSETHGNYTEKQLWQQLQQVVQQQDAQNLTNYLQPWLAEICRNPQQSLAKSVEQLQNGELKALLDTLFGNRFGGSNHQSTNSNELFSALKDLLITLRKQSRDKPVIKGTQLHPLYPNTQ